MHTKVFVDVTPVICPSQPAGPASPPPDPAAFHATPRFPILAVNFSFEWPQVRCAGEGTHFLPPGKTIFI